MQQMEHLRALPSVDDVLRAPAMGDLPPSFPHARLVDLARQALAEARDDIRQRNRPTPSVDAIADTVAQRALALLQPSLRPIINATGVLIHTNLGRVPLSQRALQAVQNVALGYSSLEYDVATGSRGQRSSHISQLLQVVTGAGAAIAVNNTAAALHLIMSALATEREVIVSRGEAVEIGGGFRIPDVITAGGASIVDVGATNRVYARDYEEAICGQTAMLLKVHGSNYAVVGFTHAPSLVELVDVGRRHEVPVVYDLGSGALLDSSRFGLAHEPTVQEALTAGVSLVCFSGDKLLGGPQAGVIAGDEALIRRLARFPTMRALRLDKMTLAALEATLRAYAYGDPVSEIPIWRMIAAPLDSLERRVANWRARLEDAGASLSSVPSLATTGGGSLPGCQLPSFALAIEPSQGKEIDDLASAARRATPPIVGHAEDGRLLLDARSVLPEQDDSFVDAMRGALRQWLTDAPSEREIDAKTSVERHGTNRTAAAVAKGRTAARQ